MIIMRRILFLICGLLLIVTLQEDTVIAEERLMFQKDDTIHTIYSFDNPEEIGHWVSVNDNVMGGLSEGVASLTDDGCMQFSGTVSLENNGGFASVRTLAKEFNLRDFKGVRIRVKGDGRTYQFRVRIDGKYDGIAFKHDFSTALDDWTNIDLLFASFQPTFRGRILTDVGPLAASEIRQVGFLVADKAAGPFSLIVDEIIAFK
jgi:monofunctional biosynthetic peptidoglycan transglycosylase